LAIQNVTSIVATGNLFITYYDLTPSHNQMYLSFAAPHSASGPINAYDRPFFKVDMTPVFATPLNL